MCFPPLGLDPERRPRPVGPSKEITAGRAARLNRDSIQNGEPGLSWAWVSNDEAQVKRIATDQEVSFGAGGVKPKRGGFCLSRICHAPHPAAIRNSTDLPLRWNLRPIMMGKPDGALP